MARVELGRKKDAKLGSELGVINRAALCLNGSKEPRLVGNRPIPSVK